MNKKILLACIAVVFSFGVATSSLASGVYVAPSSAKPYFNGAYIGVGGGVVQGLSDVESAYKQCHYTSVYLYSTHDFKSGGYGFNANIFAGYGKTFRSSYYLGGELFANYLSLKMKGSHDYYVIGPWDDLTMSTEVKNPYSFGGDARAGYLVSPRTMLYVLFGLDYARFNVKSEAQAKGWDSLSYKLITNEFNKWQLGLMPGIGMEVGLRDHVSLRTQYTYTFYSSFNHDVSLKADLATVNLKTKVKPQRSKFTIMLSYLFN
ncbi:MAG: hypothetical protein AMJ43_04340 [Coxiella sp. DG_40]|nr:MAG: hypothetical protein AMJ43_04340 [Coxiella sp. DG_40]